MSRKESDEQLKALILTSALEIHESSSATRLLRDVLAEEVEWGLTPQQARDLGVWISKYAEESLNYLADIIMSGGGLGGRPLTYDDVKSVVNFCEEQPRNDNPLNLDRDPDEWEVDALIARAHEDGDW